jgi:hypothetical protein
MGFSISYEATERISPALQKEIAAAADELTNGRTWLSCEPVGFWAVAHGSPDANGILRGASKPNFFPHPDDVAAAQAEGLPDGTVNDMLEVLCQLSAQFDVVWEISHDESDGPIGYIRQGKCDDQVREQCDAISDMTGGIDEEFDFPEE